MLPGNLLHPSKFKVAGFKEEDHDYHFRVELPEPNCCQSCGAVDGRIVKFGKDDHQIWYSPITERSFTVDSKIVSRPTANGTLKQAGLQKMF